jgi:hypothetical protein
VSSLFVVDKHATLLIGRRQYCFVDTSLYYSQDGDEDIVDDVPLLMIVTSFLRVYMSTSSRENLQRVFGIRRSIRCDRGELLKRNMTLDNYNDRSRNVDDAKGQKAVAEAAPEKAAAKKVVKF